MFKSLLSVIPLTLTLWVFFVAPFCAQAAESTTSSVVGSVVDEKARPIAGASVTAVSSVTRYSITSDASGHFVMVGVLTGVYTITASAPGFRSSRLVNVTMLPGQVERLSLRLTSAVASLGTVYVTAKSFTVGAPSDTFTVYGSTARSVRPPVSSSGLSNYIAQTVQGGVSSVPGVMFDPFANVILRGGQVDDAVFEYDTVPLPQGLIAEPGGNVAGAQLPTTGVAETTVTMAGYLTQADNALGGVVDEIPAIGSYPDSVAVQLAAGISGTQQQLADVQLLGATPDSRWRYAVAGTFSNDYFSYGDGHTFYPAEAATYGLALQSRGQSAIETNVHYASSSRDDFSVLVLQGQGAYNQYASPYAGQTIGEFNGTRVSYPSTLSPASPVDFASGIRGSYDIIKVSWMHTSARSLSRMQLYQSQFGDAAGGPFWDENGFPNGTFSFSGDQGERVEGLNYDGETFVGDHHHLLFGAQYRISSYFLNQVVPTFDEIVRSQPMLFSYLAYGGDTWNISRLLDLTAAARLIGTHIVPATGGQPYSVSGIDPHVALVQRIGSVYAFRASFDHSTVPPKPLEADRYDSTNVGTDGSPAPFVTLAPETANDLAVSFEGGGPAAFRLTYYADFEDNRIDVLPFNYRLVIASEAAPSPVGVPTNIGELRAHGLEAWLSKGGLTLDADYIRGFSSSAQQFAYFDLNAPAVAAGHLFPLGYIPNFASTLSYQIKLSRARLQIVPSLSYESGYPYGVGRLAWTFVNGQPKEVPNDNYVDPGFNYYFLRNPALPYNAATNPYIGTLGTADGGDPNSLHSAPQTLANLHVEESLTSSLAVTLDVVNIFGTASPTAYQVNPYLIGPPGYKGGNPLYAAYYQTVIGSTVPYILGNGVPTNNGLTPAVPWSYGRSAYVPQDYPLARTVQLGARWQV